MKAWCGITVVTHWRFIKAVSGLEAPNGAVLRIEPARANRGVNQLVLRMGEMPAGTGELYGGRDDR